MPRAKDSQRTAIVPRHETTRKGFTGYLRGVSFRVIGGGCHRKKVERSPPTTTRKGR